MKIHKEGYWTLVLVFILLVVINSGAILLFSYSNVFIWGQITASLLILIYFLQFFRNPRRDISADEKALLAPADGKLVVVEETLEEEYFKDKRLQVSIFMSPYNVHSNRSPVSGIVTYVKYHPGKFLLAWNPKSSVLNERSSIVLKTDTGEEILLRQIAGAVARRIKTYPKIGDRIEQGSEIGFIKFGSRVDMFLPVGTEVNLNLGEKIKAGISKVAFDYSK